MRTAPAATCSRLFYHIAFDHVIFDHLVWPAVDRRLTGVWPAFDQRVLGRQVRHANHFVDWALLLSAAAPHEPPDFVFEEVRGERRPR